MASEAHQRFLEWCRDQKALAEQSLSLMEQGSVRFFRGAQHNDATDITDEMIKKDREIIAQMGAILETEAAKF